ncbi:MAG: sulfatase-like hydrolase/transferase [bacterium]|nr:sulfatase-like hydrolase/transferase [bacterium]
MFMFTRRSFLKCLGAGAGTLALGTLAGAAESAARRPNFIFILTDDQGWPESAVQMHPDVADSRCPYLSTPNMERLAASGMRFSAGYSPGPLCTPTRRSVLVGMSTARDRGSEFKSNFFDPSEHLTIPRALKGVDPTYRCAHFGKWGENMEATPDQCGYDESDGDTGNITGNGNVAWKQGGEQFSPREDPKLIFSLTGRAMDFITRQAHAKHPFYMQVSYYAVHLQIQSRPETVEKYKEKGAPPRTFPLEFAAMAEDMDTGIGKLLDKIDALGLGDRTYVFLGADNGGSPYGRNNALYLKMLGVDGAAGRPQATANSSVTNDNAPPDALPDNYPLRGAKQWLYEGGIRVPFLARGPGIKASSWCHEPVAHYDLLPTMVDLAGGKVPRPSELDGGSLREVLEHEGKGAVTRVIPGLVFHRPGFGPGYSVYRSGNWKLVITWGPDDQPSKKELFDLSKDIGEQNNLAATQPDKTAQMWGVLSKYLKEVNAEKVSDFVALGRKNKGKGKKVRQTAPALKQRARKT